MFFSDLDSRVLDKRPAIESRYLDLRQKTGSGNIIGRGASYNLENSHRHVKTAGDVTGANNVSAKGIVPDVNGNVSNADVTDVNDLRMENEFHQFLTHGYVHGHVHQHKDHMHIHGHIHNHDHQQELTQDLHNCKEIDEINLCGDVYCDDLDDCYYYHCDEDTSHCNEVSASECCDDPKCLTEVSSSICTDPVCTKNERHDNSLCDSQNSKLSIFENLIQNVLRNIEQYSAPEQQAKRPKLEENSDFHIHFPHHCHLDITPSEVYKNYEPDLPLPLPHTVHQSCFHAKIPATMAESTFLNEKSDYDFLVQFNNFNNMFNGLQSKESHPCQWEQCLEQVSDSSLFDHVFNDHVKKEYLVEQPNPSGFDCEWNNCDFVGTDFKLFLDHLHAHTLNVNNIKPVDYERPVSMLTPSSIESEAFDLAPQIEKHDLNITKVKISKKQDACTDLSFSCRWQLGTTSDGQPVLCNKTHNDEGELQKHLQDDHIGHGKAIYRCCWHGCERNGGKEFTQRQKVYRHIHMHTGYKPCVCDECGLRFAVPAMLKQHQRMHLGERPYKCSTCGKAFSTSSALGIHSRTHSGVKPSQCTWPGCGRKFNERSNFHKHLKTHTKSYTCEVCKEECLLRKELTLHKKRAHLM